MTTIRKQEFLWILPLASLLSFFPWDTFKVGGHLSWCWREIGFSATSRRWRAVDGRKHKLAGWKASLGFMLCGPNMSGSLLMTIHPAVVGIFQSALKWCNDQLTSFFPAAGQSQCTRFVIHTQLWLIYFIVQLQYWFVGELINSKLQQPHIETPVNVII